MEKNDKKHKNNLNFENIIIVLNRFLLIIIRRQLCF